MKRFGPMLAMLVGLSLFSSQQTTRAADTSTPSCVPYARRVGDAVILPAWCTVRMEHDDRRNRLQRLARAQGLANPPRFYDYVVSRADLGTALPGYPTDIPVLRVVFDERVFFDFDHDEIRPEAEEVLNVVAASLRKEPPDVALFVAGHTDAIGSDDYNIDLSLRRADSVSRALLRRGIGRSGVFRVAFGKTMPIATNDTDEGRQMNRRVEFLFAAKPEAAAIWLAKQAAETCYQGDPKAYEKCRTAITVAQEVTLATPELPPRGSAHVTDLPVHAVSAPHHKKAQTSLGGAKGHTAVATPEVSTAVPNSRRFAIDLGSKSIAIDVPRR